MRYKGLFRGLILFLVLIGLFILLYREPVQQVEPVITVTPLPTLTLVPTETPTPTPLPTMTSPPPVVVQPNILVLTDGSTFNNAFFTAIVCSNVPVFSQPSPNYNLIIGDLYKDNLVDVTGQSQFWSRISYAMGRVGYVPTEYVAEYTKGC